MTDAAARPLRPARQSRTALTLVTGFLGAGKTTLIRHWLAGRPADERWAVMVNDFGTLAVDAAAYDGVEIGEVAGGCACCAAEVAMRVSLNRLLRRGPWDRILLELSGLGHPASLVDALLGVDRLRIDGVVAVVDAARPGPWTEAGARYRELAHQQLDSSDVIVLNRCDEAPEGQVADLRARLAAGPFGERPVLPASPDLPSWQAVAQALSGVPDRDGAAAGIAGVAERSPLVWLPTPLTGDGRRWVRRSGDGFAIAWQWPAQLRFDRRRLARWAEQAAASGPLLRGKGAFRTERDWYLWQHAAGASTWESTAWRRDNRVECLFDEPLEIANLEAGLLAALLAD